MKPKRLTRSAACLMTATTLFSASAFGREKPATENDLIPPSTPLISCDPYFSVWSPGDKLTDVETTHWTGKKQPLTSVIRIDGQAHRVMGASPAGVPALTQKSLTVLPTRSIYTFEGAGISLNLTFTTPALPDDIAVLSRPVTYLTYDFRATDGKEHDVSVFFGAGAELVVNNPDQTVSWSGDIVPGLSVVKMGSTTQKILGSKGDDHRIDWGYAYIAAPQGAAAATGFDRPEKLASNFAAGNTLAKNDGTARADQAGVGIELKALKVGDKPVSTWAMIAYDDIYGIQYNRKNLRAFWRKDGWEAKDLLAASAKEYDALQKKCAAFDEELMGDMAKIGGEQYAKITALAYRQCFAAGKFVADDNGQPLQFSKENHSNGCIATSDIFYPMAPQFLLFGPSLAKSFLAPFMEYAKSDRWKFPFAPHDLGTYPQANGQVYGGGEKTEENQMPVEESGNVLILMAAIAQLEGNADYASLYWPRLEQWAEYLKKEGFDPANQLCTDDFSGHLAHNVNLSAKAICGLGAFATLCELRGEKEKAASYMATAREYAQRWIKDAKDGDHYRLAFDRPGTWSQKYNLVWDKILGLNLFPADVYRTEMDFYLKTQNTYGLALDNRADYSKLDWILWSATLTEDQKDFQALVTPVFRFLNETPDRSPMTDWYQTKTAKKVGFTARPVVGGVFLKALYDKPLWKKYADRDVTKAKGWASMPEYIAPIITNLAPSAEENDSVLWTHTTKKPAEGWEKADFDDSLWNRNPGGFGTSGTPNAKARTEWKSDDIWLRRTVTLPDTLPSGIGIIAHHDEDIEVYINGVLAAGATGFNEGYEIIPFTKDGKAAIKPGKNVIAVHCHQTGGGQYVDVTIADIQPGKKK
ncbi:hypothetical protein GCM10023212_08390 [Luteolibacter yonseiensis]|nr:glutaminase family protein [Luteolibacter yonseiensis]